MTAKVVFAVAGYGPYWAPAVDSWLRCVAKTSRELSVESLGGVVGTGCTDRMYTSSAENRIAEGFLAIPDATHLALTETDMILPDNAILDLLALDKDIATGVYFLRNGWGQPCLYKQIVKVRKRTQERKLYSHTPVTLFPQDRPFRLDSPQASGVPGFGCVLIKRAVFETVPSPWFRILENEAGSDMYFYKEACDRGFEVWVDPRVRPDQIDYYVTGWPDYEDRLANDPDFAKSGAIVGMDQWIR